MQVVNSKERLNAKWRFAGLYLMSLAIPALLILNTINMGQVESKDTSQLVEQLRKRDQALAELSQLAVILNEAHQLKSAFDQVPKNQARYDQLHYEFENGVDKLKRLYYSDTVLYKNNYNLVTFLDFNHKDFDEISEQFKIKVEEEVTKRMNVIAGGNGGGSSNIAEILMLKKELKDAEKTIAKLESQSATISGGNQQSNTDEIESLRNKAEAMDKNIAGFNVILSGIEEDANKIQKKGDKNLEAKKKILEKVQNLKNLTTNIKNSNDILLSVVK